MDKILRIKELVKQLNKHSYNYYTLDKPTISDETYDRLYDELLQLEKETGLVLSNSPSQRIGYEIKTELEKITHKHPLRSLDKTKDVNILSKFLKGKNGILMHKLDGLTNELVYKDGKLVEASTRGNGEIGESILHNVKTYTNIPLEIPYKDEVRIIGEAIITFDVFNRINKNKEYKNPRNLVAGSVRQLDSNICKQREVKFYAYNVYDKEFDTKFKQLIWLTDQGFEIADFVRIKNGEIKGIEELRDDSERYGIPIDGLVLTFDDLNYANTLGSTAHHPLHSLAFKFTEDVEIATLEDIQYQVGRTGVVTPVAIFSPVELAGTTVSRASVHNLSILKDLQLGIGDEISIIKANDIIPQVKDNLTRSNTIQIPTECPSCGHPISIKADGEAEFLVCNNPNCKAKLIQKTSHYVSRDAMNIDGLSEATISKFIEKGFINSIVDLYKLEQYKSDIIKLEGFGLKSYNNLIKSIEKSKQCKLANFIFALGIPQVGKETAKLLTKKYDNDINRIFRADKLSLMQIDGIGEVVAREIYMYFWNEENRKFINELLTYIGFIEDKPIKTNQNGVFSNCKIYCTGTFANYKKDQLKQLVESNSGEFASGYAKSLTYLVIGSLKGSSKESKAIKDGIKVLSEDEFLQMIK